LCCISAESPEKRGDMGITLSKLVTAKRKSDDPAVDDLRSRVLSPMDGFLEEEIRVIFRNGEGR
jgi:hypothetical protein